MNFNDRLKACPLGLKSCSYEDEIKKDYSPANVFLDVPYNKEFKLIERAIKGRLKSYKPSLKPVLAKDRYKTAMLGCNVCTQIKKCEYGIVDISPDYAFGRLKKIGYNPNIFYELGIMQAFGLKCVIITTGDASEVSDISGIFYQSYNKDNRRELSKKIKLWLDQNVSEAESPASIQEIAGQPALIYVYEMDEGGHSKGEIVHSFGHRERDHDTSNGWAWEHTNKELDKNQITVYGPHIDDLAGLGKYIAVFRIKGIGIIKPEDLILKLDVTAHDAKDVLGERDIFGKDLIDGEFTDIGVEFSYKDQKRIEFRCAVIDPFDYKARINRILFDNIIIYKLEK